MELQTARTVKQEIEAIFARRAGAPRRFAVGLAPVIQGTQYAIAIRAPSPAELSEDDLAVIRKRAASEVEIQYTGAIIPLDGPAARSESRHLGIGSSVAHHLSGAGTLGFFARSNRDDAIGLVSNNHVIALQDEGEDGDEIVHPSPADGGLRPRDVIARLAGGYPPVNRAKPRVDCAFARLLPEIQYDPETLAGGQKLSRQSLAPQSSPEVCKIGRTTGLTHGRISVFELNGVGVSYPTGWIYFDGQIEIRAADDAPFSRGGDSGALVFSGADRCPVGLLFASSALGTTYANSIDSVLSALDVAFI